MADYKHYITQTQENGNVMISEDVIAAIAEHSLKDVEGATLLRDIKNWNKGIKILIADEIVRRYYGEKGGIIYSLREDLDIQESYNVLEDNDRYREILSPKK